MHQRVYFVCVYESRQLKAFGWLITSRSVQRYGARRAAARNLTLTLTQVADFLEPQIKAHLMG